MALEPRLALPSAAGHRAYSALKNPIWAKGLVRRFYAGSITGNITDTNIVPKEIKSFGDEVVWRRDPEPELFDYIKNQDLEVSTLSTEPIIMNIKRAKYWNLKMDKVDMKQIENPLQYLTAFQENAARKLANIIDGQVLLHMPVSAAPCNRGKSAGRSSANFNLGALGEPVPLTAANIINHLGVLKTVLDEANIPQVGRFVVFPVTAQVLFFNSPLSNAQMTGQPKSIIFDGEVRNMFGFDIIFSNNVPTYVDPAVANGNTYTIVAGLKAATAFVTQLSESDMIDKDPRSFSQYWRGLQLYDFKVVRPEMLAVLYATLQV